MNAAETGHFGENLCPYIRGGLFRKHVSRLGPGCVAAARRCQVEEGGCWVALAHVTPEVRRHIDREPRQVGRRGDGCGGDVQEVFHAPGLFGSADIPLDRAAQAVVIPPQVRGKISGAAAADDLRPGMRVSGPLHDEDDMPGVRALLVQPLGLVDAGLEGAFHGRGFARRLWQAAVIQLAASRAMWATTSRQARVGPVQGRVSAQVGGAGPGRAMGTALWVPTCPSSTREVNEIFATRRCRKAVIRLLIRPNFGVHGTSAVWWC